LEVDAAGNFVDGKGRYQESGTYRVLTRAGWYMIKPSGERRWSEFPN
jgi:hypothetical protein